MKKVLFLLAAGAALGLLLAPDKGEKTRMRLSKKTKRLSKETRKITDDLMEDLDRGLEAVNEWTEQVLKTVRETADSLNLKR